MKTIIFFKIKFEYKIIITSVLKLTTLDFYIINYKAKKEKENSYSSQRILSSLESSQNSQPNLTIGLLNDMLSINNKEVASHVESRHNSAKISLSTSYVDFVMKGNSNTSENSKVNSISLNEDNNINNENEINKLSNNYSYDIEHTPNSNIPKIK